MKTTVHIISHSHWDREWYLPFEKHRVKLIELMDNAMELFEKDERYRNFHLDGQNAGEGGYVPELRFGERYAASLRSGVLGNSGKVPLSSRETAKGGEEETQLASLRQVSPLLQRSHPQAKRKPDP